MVPAQTHEDALDRVLDLQHDLGKYLRLPLRMLPRAAGPAELRVAVHEALLETRRGPAGVRSARALWEAFVAESAALMARPAFAALAAAMEVALAWEAALAQPAAALPRARIDEDFAAVQAAIAALRDDVEGDEVKRAQGRNDAR